MPGSLAAFTGSTRQHLPAAVAQWGSPRRVMYPQPVFYPPTHQHSQAAVRAGGGGYYQGSHWQQQQLYAAQLAQQQAHYFHQAAAYPACQLLTSAAA
jgi:hypothetical protein